MKVAIIGAGDLGTALTKTLIPKARVEAWDIDPEKTSHAKSLAEVVDGAGVIFCCVPTFGLRKAVSGLTPHIRPEKTVVVSLSKGIEASTKKFTDKILAELVPRGNIGVMGGPMLATELRTQEGCIGTVGLIKSYPGQEPAQTLIELFAGTNLHVELSDDPHGIAIAGVLKNIYAVLMGVAFGLKVSEDEIAWLAARSMEEMATIGKHLGAQEETITGTAGFADFLATAYSEHSHNRKTGVALTIKNGKVSKSEGVVSLPSLINLLGDSCSDRCPLLGTLEKIAMKNASPKEVMEKIFHF